MNQFKEFKSVPYVGNKLTYKPTGKEIKKNRFNIKPKYRKNYEQTVEMVEKFIKKTKLNKNYKFKIEFTYDGVAPYDITQYEFIDLKNNEKLIDYVMDFFDEYNDVAARVKDVITSFSIFYTRKPTTAGGDSELNDCLFYCLRKALPPNFKMFKNAYRMKKFLNIDRDAPVEYTDLPKIEEKLGIRINLYGDYELLSKRDSKYEINLQLKKGHYKTKADALYSIMKNYSMFKEEKELMIGYHLGDTLIVYDGEDEIECDEKTAFKEYTKQYIIVMTQKRDLEKEYHKVKAEYDEMKEISDGEFNPYKFTRITSMALYYFYQHFKGLNLEPMDAREQSIHKQAFMAGLRYCKKGTYEGKVYDYDINKFYTSLFIKGVLMPTSKPTYTFFDELPEKITYGIYDIVIGDVEDNIFQLNRKSGYYTHTDLYLLKKLNIPFKLNTTKDFNAVLYDSFVNTHIMKDYLKTIYDLSKKSKYTLFKLLLNCLWGKLCEINKTITNNAKEEIIVDDGDILRTIKPDSNIVEAEIFDRQNLFKFGPLARIGCFLTAKGRYRITDDIFKNNLQDDIVYIHTDGFISLKKMDKSYLGDDVGEYKYKKYKQAIIENKSKKILS